MLSQTLPKKDVGIGTRLRYIELVTPCFLQMEECSVGFVAGAQHKSDIRFSAIIAANVSTSKLGVEAVIGGRVDLIRTKD